jgi:hypothetical protein
MTRISALRARAIAASGGNGDDWDIDSQWEDEAGSGWVKDYSGGIKRRAYPDVSTAPADGESGFRSADTASQTGGN